MYHQGHLQALDMRFNPPSPSQELTPAQSDGNDVVSLAYPDEDQTRRESSEDDGPIMARRQPREPAKEHDEGIAMRARERRMQRDNGLSSGDYPFDRPITRNSGKGSSPKNVTRTKKPGPRAWAAKPIMKNDMKAKMQVIREIESYWGKPFIKAYIPKCHRPLVKRGRGGKRTNNRSHETNPKNWLPSVLKAILMIAKLTDDKEWLKRAMNDVVRYRIKHTGNRKPQLVTTDFDVIEDMLVKHWDVAYAFEIRYKHLLVNRKDQEEDDEDIDHILQAGSDHDDGDDDGDDDDDDVSQLMEEDRDDDDESEGRGQGRTSGKYLCSSGYTNTANHYPPPLPRQQARPLQARKDTPTPKQAQPKLSYQQQHNTYGYGLQMPGYGALIDPWGRPMPGYPGGPEGYNGYGGYSGAYPGYGGYGPPQHVRHGSRQSHPPGMSLYAVPPSPAMMAPPENSNQRRSFPPSHANERARIGYEPAPGFEMQGYPQPYQGGRSIKIKRESPPIDERDAGGSDFDAPTNDLGAQNDDDDDEAALDAEMKAMELQLQLAQMKARKAAMQQRAKAKK